YSSFGRRLLRSCSDCAGAGLAATRPRSYPSSLFFSGEPFDGARSSRACAVPATRPVAADGAVALAGVGTGEPAFGRYAEGDAGPAGPVAGGSRVGPGRAHRRTASAAARLD